MLPHSAVVFLFLVSLTYFLKVTLYARQLYHPVALNPAIKQNLLDMSHIAVISRCFKSHMMGQCVISWLTKVVPAFTLFDRLQNTVRLYRIFFHSLVITHCKKVYESINIWQSYISWVTECSMCISVPQVGCSIVTCELTIEALLPGKCFCIELYMLAVSWSAVQCSVCTL